MGIDETKGGTICYQLGSGGSCEDWQWVTSINQSYYLFIRSINQDVSAPLKGASLLHNSTITE